MRINKLLAKEKGLITDNDSLYKELNKNYKYLLEYYLNSIIDFKKYENIIDNSDLYIGKTHKCDLNIYLNLDYLYFINDLFIEKLDLKDLDLLKNFNKKNITNELLDMVKRTFVDVIKNNYTPKGYSDKSYYVFYGPTAPINMVKNDALVFRFYYGKNLIDLEGKELLKLFDKQMNFINEQMNLLKKEIHDKLHVNCEILIRKEME